MCLIFICYRHLQSINLCDYCIFGTVFALFLLRLDCFSGTLSLQMFVVFLTQIFLSRYFLLPALVLDCSFHHKLDSWSCRTLLYKNKKESSNITHVQYISDTHAVSVCDFIQFHRCVFVLFCNICYTLRFKDAQYPANVSQMKDVFSCSKKEKKNKNCSFLPYSVASLVSEII